MLRSSNTHTHTTDEKRCYGRNIDALYELVGKASSENRHPGNIRPDKIRSAAFGLLEWELLINYVKQ